jgi:hypothetical protein
MSSYGTVTAIGSSKLSSGKQRRPRQYIEDKLMKRSFKQRFKDWLFHEPPEQSNYVVGVDEDSIQLTRDKSLRFEIHSANGGRIVQTRRYDSQKDRHIENLYIVTNDMDFGREIDKIITMEALR